MIFVGLAGILLSLCCYWIAVPNRNGPYGKVFFGIACAHITAAVIYWQYSINFVADSTLYYNDPLGQGRRGFATGTAFVVTCVQFLKKSVGGSYLDYFLLFQAFGVAGIALMIRSLHEVLMDLLERPNWKFFVLFFLPGLHFWTSAIGKDAPLFFAICLSMWAMINIEKRFLAFFAALVVMAPIRPHIAAIASIALLATLLLDRRIRLIVKAPLLVATAGAAIWIVATAQQAFSLATLNPGSLGEFIASKQEYGTRTEAGSVLTALPLPLKIASLLFRPFFFDARGIFGMIVSLENLALLMIFATMARRAKDLIRLCVAVPFMRYCLAFSITLILLLSLVTYNVGLGLRQKYMVMPAVLLMFMTLVAFRRATTTPDPRGAREDLPLRHAGPVGPELTPPR